MNHGAAIHSQKSSEERAFPLELKPLSQKRGVGFGRRPCSAFIPNPLNILRLQRVDFGELAVRRPTGAQELIKFSLQSLGVPVFGALNNKRHEYRSQSGKAVPIERTPIKNEP
jgi:hypothetical protein